MRLTLLTENWAILLVCALGLVAVYALLPRPRRLPLLLGVGAAVLALVLAGWLVVRVGKLSLETFLFYLFAAIAIVAGGLLVTQQNPARAALSFAIVVLATCGLFLLQAAPFLMAATIIVYAGAIIVTFLFVIMLAQQQGLSDADARSREPLFTTITGFVLLATLLYVLKLSYKPDLDQWVHRSEEYLARAQEMRKREEPPSEDERDKFAADLNQFLADYRRWWFNRTSNYPSGGQRLKAAIDDAQFYAVPLKAEAKDDGPRELASLDKVESELTKVHDAGVDMRNSPLLGNSHPASDAAKAGLSEFSGPRPSRLIFPEEKRGEAADPPELRRDGLGRPMMPARNTAYLGRSLFSDYLLPVELAGMLLLVATIGAIAIAQRRSPSPTPGSPGSPGPIGTLGTGPSQERTL